MGEALKPRSKATGCVCQHCLWIGGALHQKSCLWGGGGAQPQRSNFYTFGGEPDATTYPRAPVYCCFAWKGGGGVRGV